MFTFKTNKAKIKLMFARQPRLLPFLCLSLSCLSLYNLLTEEKKEGGVGDWLFWGIMGGIGLFLTIFGILFLETSHSGCIFGETINMKTHLLKHPKSFFGFRKDKMYHSGTLKTTFTFAFSKFRLMFS